MLHVHGYDNIVPKRKIANGNFAEIAYYEFESSAQVQAADPPDAL